MNKNPPSVTVTYGLILVNAAFWLAFAIITGLGLHPSLPDLPVVKCTMTLLALLACGTLTGLYLFMRRRLRIAYYLMLGLILLISVLSITDEVGLSDLIILAVNLATLALLLKDRTWYLSRTMSHTDVN